MDQQQAARGRSPSAGHQQPHSIRQSHSPSPNPYPANEASIGLGLGIDATTGAPQQQQLPAQDYNAYATNHNNNYLSGSTGQAFPPGGLAASAFAPNPAFNQQQFKNEPAFALDPSNYNEGDFALFPPSGQSEQYGSPLFSEQSINPNEVNNMSSAVAHHSPTPPHLIKLEPHQPGSAHHSPSFNQHQFSSPGHSRNVSLGPEAALLAHQVDWNAAQFQGHRRTPSEYSDVSSVSPSPNLASADTFDNIDQRHSPLQRPQDASMYQEVLSIGNFSISDQQAPPGTPGQRAGRSPSHSPAISPRILPQSMPELSQGNFVLAPGQPSGSFAGPSSYGPETFPVIGSNGPPPGDVGPHMAAPTINIDFAPSGPPRLGNFEAPKPTMDQDSLTPPDRGRQRSRPRAVTDPYSNGGAAIQRPSTPGSLSPNMGGSDGGRESSRSLSPAGQTNAQSRRRQSMSSVPNNVMALRLADPDGFGSSQDNSPRKIQKHPATFQCTLCPKRFTRAYNLRSHLRTHTDERPFVCTVCGKAFARQHDRKRHEGLHSGEKKFVCKGDLLKAGGQWGCGRRFARADALGRHFRSEAGRICIKPLLDEEMLERQRIWNEQRMQASMANMAHAQPPPPMIDPNTGYPIDASGNYALPAALLAQYPALAQVNWAAPEGQGGMDDELSGRSSFDASDYDDADDTGYVSGPGTGFGPGGLEQGFGEMGYASDYGGR